MSRKIRKLTPRLLKRIIQEEKLKIKSDSKRSKKLTNKQLVESLRKLLLLRKAQRRAGQDFKNIYETRLKIKKKVAT